MITPEQVIGKWQDCPDLTAERRVNINDLCDAVNPLLRRYENETGTNIPTNPHTGSQVSGNTFGGFRPQDCPQGSTHSSHKEGLGVDIYDPNNALDAWITDAVLIIHDLYREHPNSTDAWCHLTTRKPPSGHRTFIP